MNNQNRKVTLEDEVDFIFRESASLLTALRWTGLVIEANEVKLLCEMHECRRIQSRNRFDSAAQKLLESFITRVELYCLRIRTA